MNCELYIEPHPLRPFLPEGAKVLMLGSFPPPRKRWSMEFYYPNPQNDMWRILGLLATGDRHHFLTPDRRKFDQPRIEAFCRAQGIALYDTAEAVIRLKENASDNFLQVVRPTDLGALLGQIPECRTLVVTGQKAAETLAAQLGCVAPQVGESVEVTYAGKVLTLWRMPSSSRAFPKPLEWKAERYRKVFGFEL